MKQLADIDDMSMAGAEAAELKIEPWLDDAGAIDGVTAGRIGKAAACAT
jgi:hypothetical protein